MSPVSLLLLDAVAAALDELEEAQQELCRLDSVTGDGDEGFAMAGAARRIRAELTRHPPADAAALVQLAAQQFAAMGGTMGAITYVLLDSVGAAPEVSANPVTATEIARLLALAEEAVSAFGGARRGDKTILDAIAGARDAAEACARAGEPTAAALSTAAAAAAAAAQATADMTARTGRASRLGDQSRGTVDPGAKSFAIAISALARAYAAGQHSGQARTAP